MAEIGTPSQAVEAGARLIGNMMAMVELESEPHRAECGSGTC